MKFKSGTPIVGFILNVGYDFGVQVLSMGLRLGFFSPLLAQWMITPFVLFVLLVLFFIVNQRC